VFQSPAAPPTAPRLGTPEEFAKLLDGFRARLDREIAAFLDAKRASALSGGEVSGAPARERGARSGLSDLADLVEGVARLMVQGGKRLRPALVYYTYRACGGRSDEQALPLAVATEFLHTYLLIHDDIMDHAETRRGQPAAHVRFRDLHLASGLRGDAGDFGRSVAILLGDLAHTYAVELFTAAAALARWQPPLVPLPPLPPDAAPPRHWTELNRCFSDMCEEVIGGQYLEFLLAHRRNPDPGSSTRTEEETMAGFAAREAELLRILQLKSGRYTAERPIQLGALLAGAPPEVRAELSRYGTAVGEAFQLQDDLLGLFGDPETIGKPVGDDLREGKFTFLIHHALSSPGSPGSLGSLGSHGSHGSHGSPGSPGSDTAGGSGDRQLVTAALGKADLTAGEVAGVQRVLERTGARRAVTAMIAERLTEARRALDALAGFGLGPRPALSGDGLLFLSGLLDYLREREQ
jgi:geranylgeranyl diphosphate synthase type I